MNGPAFRLAPYGLAFFSSLCIMVLELVASRLVARHVGASLTVWTSVIGVMLGGICLGNVLGGRLADRVDPRRAVGPLYAAGAALTLLCLWINAGAGAVPDAESVPWLRALIIVAIDFLVPTTVLGMISPVVAKMAVEDAGAGVTGTAVGLVYFLGSVGSIVGTFIAGFYLMYFAATTEIVQVVAAGLFLMAAALLRGPLPRLAALAAAVALLTGSIGPLARTPADLGQQHYANFPARLSIPALVGNALAAVAAIAAISQLISARRDAARAEAADPTLLGDPGDRPRLGDLAALSFVASLAFMALEMDAGRMVQRHLGSSIYGWTSIIGVLLGGLSLGNLLGGLIANRVRRETQASWLFLVASLLTLSVLLLESPPRRLVWNPYEHFVRGANPEMVFGSTVPVLSRAIGMKGWQWSSRILLVVTAVFLLPSIALGTVSPVVAKLAVDRLRASKRTGSAIGQVYAWGMVGSLLGTFLTGFVLIDALGTKGVILALGVVLAFAATYLGSIWHAAWAGIPLGLCIIAFYPAPFFQKQGLDWGIREERGDPDTDGDDTLAYVDESDYYYIKVANEPDAEGKKRTLVLDNLIHGYFILGHPERLDYDYEHIYALVADRVARAKAGPALAPTPAPAPVPPPGTEPTKAEATRLTLATPLKTMFLGGGAYTFQRYMQDKYPGTAVDVAEIDPAVTRANFMATGLPRDTPIRTTWGDARAFVERNKANQQYDLIFGDAFNDFSVPWHLTTREFNDMLAQMMSPDGVYMINIIDLYESDATARRKASDRLTASARDAAEAALTVRMKSQNREPTEADVSAARAAAKVDPDALSRAQAARVAEARTFGGFLSAWVKTARLTFPHVAIYGTDEDPGAGLRETFVVVASKRPLDLEGLGGREVDPRFFQNDRLFEPKPYGDADMKALEVRSRGIVLTDDYAPVENLLAKVAATRGDE